MPDAIVSNLAWGVAGNLATNVVQFFGDKFNDTKVGRALVKAGLLKAGFNQRMQDAIRNAAHSFILANPIYQLPEVYSFLESRPLARDLRDMIVEQKGLDSKKIAERLSHYVGISLDLAPDSWPNNIDPYVFVDQLFTSLINTLGKESDPGLIWLSIAITKQDTKLQDISNKLDEIKIGQSELGISTQRTQQYAEFRSAYIDHISSRAQRVSTPGARELRGINQSLSVAYISLNLKSAVGAEAIRAEEFLAEHKHVAIRGPAGSGKTTLLNWLITKCQESDSSDEKWNKFVPFFIPLRKVARLHAGPPSLERIVEYSVDNKLWTLETPSGWLNKVISKEKNAILMIDGVDELPPSRRVEFWEWVNEFVEAYPDNRVVITSRALPTSQTNGSANDQWNPPRSFIDAQLQDMSDSDVTSFVHHWHDAIDHGKLEDQEIVSLAEARSSLPAKLEDSANRRIRELCNTPLLCAMICVLHWKEEGYLPRQRVEVYERCCDMLIEARDHKRGVLPPPGPIAAMTKSDKEMVLQQLAIEMMHNRDDTEAAVDDNYRIEISRDKALSWLEPQIKRFQNSEAREATSGQVLDYLVERTGLLREPAKDLIDFPHRTFQEYLAACAAGADSQEKMLANQADDDQWHETIMLAAGTNTGGVGFGRKLIETLIKKGERHQSLRGRSQRIRKTCFALALGCLENLRQQDEELREAVLSNLGELVPPRGDGDARILSVAGDAAVSYLSYDQWKDENTATVAACAKALRLIGTNEALKSLGTGYISDSRQPVISEVCSTGFFHYSDVPLVISSINKFGSIPAFAQASDLMVIKNISTIINMEIDTKDGKNLHLFSGLTGLKSAALRGLSHDSEFLDILPVSIEKLSLQGSSLPAGDWLKRLRDLDSLTLIGLAAIEIERIIDSVDDISNLSILASKFDNIGKIRRINGLKEIYFGGINNVNNLSVLYDFPGIEKLTIEECPNLQNLELTDTLPDLKHLSIEQTNSPFRFTGEFGGNSSLQVFSFSYCSEIENLDFIGSARKLNDVSVGQCANLRDIDAISDLHDLHSLSLTNLDLVSSPRIPCLNIEKLNIQGISNFDMNSVKGMNELEDFNIERCVKLEEFDFLADSLKLKSFSLASAPRVSNLLALRNKPDLRYVNLMDCDGIESLDFLEGCPVSQLTLISMDGLRSIEFLENITDLRVVTILDCDGISDLSPLASLPNLEQISLHPHDGSIRVPESLLPKISRNPVMQNIYFRQRKPWWANGAWTMRSVNNFRRPRFGYKPYEWYE